MILVALKMLLGDRIKYVGVIAGVLFTTALTSLLLSMFAGIMERTSALVRDVGYPDIWVMDPAVEQAEDVAPLPATALDRVRSVAGVGWATRFYTGGLRARLRDGRFRTVTVLGLDSATLLGGPRTMVEGTLDGLRRPDAVIVDNASTTTFLAGPKPAGGGPRRPLQVGDEMAINDQRVFVAGLADVTPRFNDRPTIYTTYELATRIAPPERNLLSFVLVGVAEGQDPTSVARQIEASTRLRARTRAEFAADTFWYFVQNTPIVANVSMMVGIGAVVGFAVSGLMLFMFTSENMRYYGALKAMGLSNDRLIGMIIVQAVLASALGAGLGLLATVLAGRMMLAANMPFRMHWFVPVVIVGLTIAICMVSAFFSASRVRKLEPAVVFR